MSQNAPVYRRKTRSVRAVQIPPDRGDLPAWVLKASDEGEVSVPFKPLPYDNIPTGPEYKMIVGWWAVESESHVFDVEVIPDDEFHRTYEEVR